MAWRGTHAWALEFVLWPRFLGLMSTLESCLSHVSVCNVRSPRLCYFGNRVGVGVRNSLGFSEGQHWSSITWSRGVTEGRQSQGHCNDTSKPNSGDSRRAIHDRLSMIPRVPVAERCQLTQQQWEAAFEQGAALLVQTSVLWMATLSSGTVVTSEVSGSCKNLFMSFCEWYPGNSQKTGQEICNKSERHRRGQEIPQ